MERKQDEIAMIIGMLLLGSGYEKLLLELAAIEEKDFLDPDNAPEKDDVVLGPMSRFEKAAWTLATRIDEGNESKIDELKTHVCPTCPVGRDCERSDAPCRDLQLRMAMPDQLRSAMWDSMRKRLGHPSSIAIRTGFMVAKCPPSKERRGSIGIEIIEVTGGKGMSGLMAAILGGASRSSHKG